MLPRIVAINSRRHVFQYKVLNNAFYLNKHLYIFKLSDTKLCSFSNHEDESIIHLSGNYHKSKIFPNTMRGRKEFSSKSEVKFRFISKLLINFIMGGTWVYFWH